MPTYEHNGVLSYKDESGNVHLLYPVTKKDNVDGMDEMEANVKRAIEGSIPSGCILIWSGNEFNIPDGWALCNGENGTPDLRDRFVLGAGTSYVVGKTGGEAEVKLTNQQMPSHTHGQNSPDAGSSFHPWVITSTTQAGGIAVVTNIGASKSNQSITSRVYTDSSGGSQPHNNMPPYYALCYIMKL